MKRRSSMLAFAFAVSLLAMPMVQAQSVSLQETAAIVEVIDEVENALLQGNANAIVELLSEDAAPTLATAITEAINGKRIIFTEDINAFNRLSSGDIEVQGSFIAESSTWSISGLGNEFIFTEENGEWKILDTNFHEKFDFSGILEIVLQIVSLIFIPLFIMGIFWFWMLIDAIVRPVPHKVIWILIIFFFNALGALIYFFAARRPHKKQQQFESGQGASALESIALLLLIVSFFGSIAWGGYGVWNMLKNSGVLTPMEEGTPFSELMEMVDEEVEEFEERLEDGGTESQVLPTQDNESPEDEESEEPEDQESLSNDESEGESSAEDESLVIEEDPETPADESIENEVIESSFTDETPDLPPGTNERGDRIYLDENTNVFVEYKSGEVVQLIENGGTTRGCGTSILYYTNPVLSDDSQYAILPLYCEGDPTEIWVKNVNNKKSYKITLADSADFIEEGGLQKIQTADGRIFDNPLAASMTPEDTVKKYMAGLLSRLASQEYPYDPEASKALLHSEVRGLFDEPSFVPRSLGIQDGPERLTYASTTIYENTATVVMNAEYGSTSYEWTYIVELENGEWRIADYNSLKTAF